NGFASPESADTAKDIRQTTHRHPYRSDKPEHDGLPAPRQYHFDTAYRHGAPQWFETYRHGGSEASPASLEKYRKAVPTNPPIASHLPFHSSSRPDRPDQDRRIRR